MKKYNYVFISILISYILVLVGLFLYFFLLKDYISIPACPIYTNLGIYCPACGRN